MFEPLAAALGDGGSTGVSTVSYQTSNYAIDYNGSITMPSGISAGDVIIVLQSSYNLSGGPSAAYGTGFSSVGTVSNSWNSGEDMYSHRTCMSMKIADGTEASSSIGGFMNGTRECAVVYVYRPDTAATTITAQDVETQATNGNPTGHTINASSSTKVAIVVALGQGTNGGSINMTWSATSDQSYDGATVSSVYSGLDTRATGYDAGSAVDVTTDTDDASTANHIISCYIEVE